MKSALAFLLVLCTGSLLTHGALRTEKLFLFGTEYYRLNDWARANGFTVRWLTKQNVELSRASTKMVFTTDSRRMLFNGTVVWLSHAIGARSGVAYLSVADVNSALAPILWPARNPPKKTVKHICIDAGHGGKDPGNRAGRVSEKTYTLLLAQELAQQLRKAGYTVSFTRSNDTFIDLTTRPAIARRRGADVFISLHFNAASATTVRGAETYCMTPQRASSTNARGEGRNTGALPGNQNDARNMLLAYEIHRAVVRQAGVADRGVKRARYAVLRTAEVPSVLVEAGFMSNPTEARNIYSSVWRQKVAQGIVTGLRNYRTAIER